MGMKPVGPTVLLVRTSGLTPSVCERFRWSILPGRPYHLVIKYMYLKIMLTYTTLSLQWHTLSYTVPGEAKFSRVALKLAFSDKNFVTDLQSISLSSGYVHLL